MTKEERNLLIKDVCHRLPYGLKAADEKTIYNVVMNIQTIDFPQVNLDGLLMQDYGIRPVLFPLTALTQEIAFKGETFIPLQRLGDFERGRIDVQNGTVRSPIREEGSFSIASFGTTDEAINYKTTGCFFAEILDGLYTAYHQYQMFDEMDRYMIDYRGLIDKGLAVSVFSLDVNPYKDK